VVGVECMFSWYWIADFCAEHNMAHSSWAMPYT
jgi:hypothetical protein